MALELKSRHPVGSLFSVSSQTGAHCVRTTSQGITSSHPWRWTEHNRSGRTAQWKDIRPAALRAGIPKRIGRHTLRHTFGTLLKANGEDVATVQSLMRHGNVS